MTPPPEPVELEIRRVVPASPERVFDAWTSPAALRQWWGPPGGGCSEAEVDLRIGGRYRIVNVLPDRSTVAVVGEFLDIVAPDKLTYTWATDPATAPEELVTVLFKPHEEGTEVIVSHQRIAHRDLLDGHRAGWHGCLDGLVAHVAPAGPTA